MKTRLLIFAAALCLGFQTQAQFKASKDFNVEVGRPYKVVDAIEKLYQTNGDNIVALKIGKKNLLTIQVFDTESYKLLKTKVYKDLDKDAYINNFKYFDGKFYLFYSLWDGKADNEQLFVREIDPRTAAFAGTAKLLIKVDGKLTGTTQKSGMMSMKIVDKFKFEFSKKNQRFLVYYRKKPTTRNDSKSHDRIGAYVFLSNMEEQWNKEISMPYTEAKMDLFDYSLDEAGNVYVLGKVYRGSTPKAGKKNSTNPNYNMELFTINAESQEISTTEITLDGKFVLSVGLLELDNEHMIIGGYYGSAKTLGTDGVFMYKVSKDGELTDEISHEIPLEILNQNESKRSAKKNSKKQSQGKAALSNLVLDKILATEDGSLVLIGEQYFVASHTRTTSNGGTSTTYTYHYNDILVTKMSTTGDVNWMIKIPKAQVGGKGKGGMSYKYMNNGNHHYLLYVDNEKNLRLRDTDVPAGHSDGRGGILTSTKITHEDGASTKESLFDLENVKGISAYQFSTGRVIKISEEEIAVEVYKKKKEDVWISVRIN